ncbi:MAG TPA: hypothetical protein VI455_10890 [Terriglobia bacterium]
MPKTPSKQGASAAKKPAGAISLAKLPPELARSNIKALLLANPNYFGNLKDSEFQPVLSIQGDTAYENIGCVGFNPQLNRLEAEVNINQEGGYDGDVCSNGSQEFVRFYLSYDGGATWQDQGLTSFAVYDVPGPKPLEYDATLQINPPEGFCFFENLPTARAILSWNTPPPANSPGWTPIWGDVVDARIQIAGFEIIVLNKFLAEAKVELPAKYKDAVDLTQSLKAAPPKVLSGAELHNLYKGKNVPAHRFLFSELKQAIGEPTTKFAQAPPSKAAIFGIEAVNLEQLIEALLNTDGDTTYEELDCVGLNPNLDQLVGVINVKLSSGYSGGPCTAGSPEYVAFWVDWNDGKGWTYVGTNSVTVHDFSAIPPGGLKYSVVQPVDIASHQQPCDQGPKTATVRAVLSWDVPPSTVDPYAPVTWGNSDETTILLDPGTPFVTGTPDISIIGGIGIAEIDTSVMGLTLPFATFANFGPSEYADPWDNSRQCPFGGLVDVHGQPTPGMKYRVSVRKVGSSSLIRLTDTIYTVDKYGVTTARTPDGQGFFDYLTQDQNQLSLLAYWISAGDDLWEMMLEIADALDNVQSSTPWYRIQLDNTGPETSAQLVPPTIDLHIDSGGDCKDFNVATEIDGHFVAVDTYFGVWTLQTLPSTISPPPNEPASFNPVISSTTETEVYPGHQWKLDTTGMTPCGYVVQLQVWDRSIVGSYPGSHNYNHAEVGFCLRATD